MAGEPADVVLELEIKAFPRDRRVEWLLEGRPLGEVEVTPGWRRYDLRLGTLARGEHTLTLACRAPAEVGHHVLGNGDPRRLALAVGDWRVRASVQN